MEEYDSCSQCRKFGVKALLLIHLIIFCLDTSSNLLPLGPLEVVVYSFSELKIVINVCRVYFLYITCICIMIVV